MRKTKGGVRILTPPFVFAESAAIPSRMGIGNLICNNKAKRREGLVLVNCKKLNGAPQRRRKGPSVKQIKDGRPFRVVYINVTYSFYKFGCAFFLYSPGEESKAFLKI